MISQDKSA